jgi:hypothetical protein
MKPMASKPGLFMMLYNLLQGADAIRRRTGPSPRNHHVRFLRRAVAGSCNTSRRVNFRNRDLRFKKRALQAACGLSHPANLMLRFEFEIRFERREKRGFPRPIAAFAPFDPTAGTPGTTRSEPA